VSQQHNCCVFTELSRAHSDARMFLDNSIDIMTVKEFVRGFMGKTIEQQPSTKLCKCLYYKNRTIWFSVTSAKRDTQAIITQSAIVRPQSHKAW